MKGSKRIYQDLIQLNMGSFIPCTKFALERFTGVAGSVGRY